MSADLDLSWDEFDANRAPGPGRPAAAAPQTTGFYAKASNNAAALVARLRAGLPASALGKSGLSSTGKKRAAKKAAGLAHTTNLVQQKEHNRHVAEHERKRVAAQVALVKHGRQQTAKRDAAGAKKAQAVRAVRLAAAQRLISQRTP